MARPSLGTEKALAILSETPGRLAAAAAGLTEAQLRKPPAPGDWSATEVLAHLRACADVRGGAALKILAEDRPTFRAVDPRRWMEDTDYQAQPFHASLKAFARRRRTLLAALKPLREQDWARKATVTGAGRELERTVLFYAEWIARHERPHIKQMQRIAETMRPGSGR